ncbi:MAG: hypothetical protein ACKVX7_13860 [Planctomycetota bacterium]
MRDRRKLKRVFAGNREFAARDPRALRYHGAYGLIAAWPTSHWDFFLELHAKLETTALAAGKDSHEGRDAAREVLTFDDLRPYLLLKNGNYLYKVPFRGGWAVLKVYYGSRSALSNIFKSLENLLLAGQTSYMPRTRLRIERECLELWRDAGFRVFRHYPEVKVCAPGCPEGGYMLFEYLSRVKLNDYLRDEQIPVDERFATYRRWLPVWSRRHDLAIERREPRLVHENGDGKHVMILENGEFLWFDFEMVYRRPSRTAECVSHEIIQYIWNIRKSLPEALRERFMEETVGGYPRRDRLLKAYEFFYRHPNVFHRVGRALDRRLRARAQKAGSKYRVALELKEKLSCR